MHTERPDNLTCRTDLELRSRQLKEASLAVLTWDGMCVFPGPAESVLKSLTRWSSALHVHIRMYTLRSPLASGHGGAGSHFQLRFPTRDMVAHSFGP